MNPDQTTLDRHESQFAKILRKLASFHVQSREASPATVRDPARAPDKPQGLKKRVFLVEDHALMRRSIVGAIEREPDLTVCGQAEEAVAALAAILSLPPDIVLTDIRLKSSNGLDLIKSLRARLPALPVVATTMFDARHIERLARDAGALGFVSKGDGPDKMIAVIREVLEPGERDGNS
jgi:DNA-binding NtrC family response regulator